ncbi:hypothetical protein GEMRC1_002164 [Eukaryota sp. GEM-RC1]
MDRPASKKVDRSNTITLRPKTEGSIHRTLPTPNVKPKSASSIRVKSNRLAADTLPPAGILTHGRLRTGKAPPFTSTLTRPPVDPSKIQRRSALSMTDKRVRIVKDADPFEFCWSKDEEIRQVKELPDF